MPCLHKFAEDLYLKQLDFMPSTLIIGTFNPGWPMIGNSAPWFYGRTQNNYFWEVLPRLYGHQSLRKLPASEWKSFCKSRRIALTDLIYRIDDADEDNPRHAGYIKSYRDDLLIRHFRQFTFVDIPRILQERPAITRVFLTRSVNNRFWQQRWQLVQNYCQQHGVRTRTLLTPSGSARFQIPKNTNIRLGDFIFNEWEKIWFLG